MIERAGFFAQVYALLVAKASLLRPRRRGRVGRFILASVFAVLVMVGVYRSSAWGAILVMAIDPADPALGLLVTRRMIEMGSLLLLSALGISSLVTALTTFFLARDLDLLHPMPIRPTAFYGARLLEVGVQSSWVLVPIVIPMFFGVGRALHAGIAYYVVVPFVVFLLVVPIAAGAVGLATVVARVVPASRAREVFLLLAGVMFVAFYMLVRSAKPEQFIDPDRFKTLPALLESLGVSNPWLPSTWAADCLLALAGGGEGPWLAPALTLLGVAALSVLLGAALHLRAYAEASSRAREVRPEPVRRGERLVRLTVLLGRLTGRRGVGLAIFEKEVRTTLRDPQQWTQILMLGVLLVLFVYNFRFLNDLHLGDGADVVFNLALTGFVIGALGARFVFPLVSLEGHAFWLLRSAPVSTRELLAAKTWAAFIALEILAVAMTAAAAFALELPPLSTVISLLAVTPLAYMAAALGIGLGAAYPRFGFENPVMIPMSFGGMMYVYWSLGTVLAYSVLLAWPLVTLHRPTLLRTPLAVGLTALLALFALGLPWLSGWLGFRLGVSRLDEDAEVG